MSAQTLPRNRTVLSRTAAGRVIGGCDKCGTGISIPGQARDMIVVCPGCGIPVRLTMVCGRMADDECDVRCLYAVGPDCECNCGGANHGDGYAVTLLPSWLPVDGVAYQTVTMPDVPDHVAKRNRTRRDAVAGRAIAKAEAKRLAADAYRAGLLADHPELSELIGERFADSDSGFVLDMRRMITAGEELTPNMISACVRVVTATRERDARRAAADQARAAAVAAGVRIEPGKQAIRGTVVWFGTEPNTFAYNAPDRKVMIVQDAAGRRFKGTFPEALHPVWAREIADAYIGWPDRVRGQRVTIVATVKPSDNDPLFGYFSRPTVPAGTPTVSHIGPADQAPDSTTAPTVSPARPRPARKTDPAPDFTPTVTPVVIDQPAASFVSGW